MFLSTKPQSVIVEKNLTILARPHLVLTRSSEARGEHGFLEHSGWKDRGMDPWGQLVFTDQSSVMAASSQHMTCQGSQGPKPRSKRPR